MPTRRHPLIIGILCLSLATASNAAPPTAPPVTAVTFSPDGQLALVGSQAGIVIYAWPDMQVTRTLATELSHVHDLAFSPDGKTLLAAGGLPAEEGVVEIWDWDQGERRARRNDHDDLVYGVAWRADGRQWATASWDGTCHVYDASNHARLQTYEGHSRPVLAICYLPGQSLVVSAGVDQTVQVWDPNTGQLVRKLNNHVATVHQLVVRPNSQPAAIPVLASVSDDQTVRIWQPTIGRLLRFKRFPAAPRSLVWSPSGDQLVVGCVDGHLRTFTVDTLEIRQDEAIFPGPIYALASPMGSRQVLAAGSHGMAVRVTPGE